MPTFIRCRHEGVEGDALLPTTALRHMPGWVPVSTTEAAPADGTVAEVLAEVGDDPVKAAAALEQERAGRGRSTLVDRLQSIADHINDQES